MKEIDKKYIVVLILSVVMISILAAASFSFMGNFKKEFNNSNVNIAAGNANNTYFNVTNDVSFSLNVDPTLMSEANNGSYVAENTSILDVSLSSGVDGVGIKCTYDIVFEYDSSSNIYGVSPTPVTTGADKELTLQIIGPNGKSDYFDEKNFNLSTRIKTIVTGAEIVNSFNNLPTVQRWQFVNRFYNLNLDQTALANKLFKGKYYVTNISCDKDQDNTIYSLVKSDYKNNNSVKLYSDTSTQTYTNPSVRAIDTYSDASPLSSSLNYYANPIYYFSGNYQVNNNVLFAGFCWNMIRTTENGGVKILYNGVPKDEYDSSLLEQDSYQNLNNDTTYPYTFNSTNKTWTSSNKANNTDGTISFTVPESGDYILHFDISSFYSENIYATFYKNDVELKKTYGINNGDIVLENLTTSDVIKVVYTKKYILSVSGDRVVFSIGKSLGTKHKTCNNSDSDSIIGDNKFNTESNSLGNVGYMYNSNYAYTNKWLVTYQNIAYFGGTKTIGDSASWDGSKYTINNGVSVNVSKDTIESIVGKYTCSNTACTGVRYIKAYDGKYVYYIDSWGGKVNANYEDKDYVFGGSFEFVNGIFVMKDTITLNLNDWPTKHDDVNNHHYTCLSDTNKCQTIYYIFYADGGQIFYISLNDGKTVDMAINEMLYSENVNKNDSTVKTIIDNWYKDNLLSYTDRLEDAVFCNNRKITDYGGWDPNGGNISDALYFEDNTNTSLICENDTDRFMVSNPKAKLTYPVGLLSAPETRLFGGNSSFYNIGRSFWLSSPISLVYGYISSVGNIKYITIGGGGVASTFVIRPVVSLKAGTRYTSGDGTYTNPYVIN